MAGQDDEANVVRVSAGGPNALSEPIFLIKHGDVYYITLAVWEYDPSKAQTDEQKDAYAVVHEHFARHGKGATSAAMTLSKGSPVAMTSTTKPPQPKPKPTGPATP